MSSNSGNEMGPSIGAPTIDKLFIAETRRMAASDQIEIFRTVVECMRESIGEMFNNSDFKNPEELHRLQKLVAELADAQAEAVAILVDRGEEQNKPLIQPVEEVKNGRK